MQNFSAHSPIQKLLRELVTNNLMLINEEMTESLIQLTAHTNVEANNLICFINNVCKL